MPRLYDSILSTFQSVLSESVNNSCYTLTKNDLENIWTIMPSSTSDIRSYLELLKGLAISSEHLASSMALMSNLIFELAKQFPKQANYIESIFDVLNKLDDTINGPEKPFVITFKIIQDIVTNCLQTQFDILTCSTILSNYKTKKVMSILIKKELDLTFRTLCHHCQDGEAIQSATRIMDLEI